MKLDYKLPKGWRWIELGERLLKTDYAPSCTGEWLYIRREFWRDRVYLPKTFIRRLPPRSNKGK